MTATSEVDTDKVLAAVRGLTMLHLEWIRRHLRAVGADAALAAARLDELFAALHEAGEAAGPVLIDPRVSRWCAEVSNLLDRGAGTLLPDGHFRAACRKAGTLALSARVLGAQAGAGADVPSSRVRTDHAGQVRLLGTRMVVDCGAEFAGLDVTVEVRQGRPVMPEIAHARLTIEPAPLPGVVVSHADPVDVGRCGSDPIVRTRSPVVAVERGMYQPRSAALPGIALVPATASAQWRGAHIAAAAAHLRSAATGQVLSDEPRADPPAGIADIADYGHLARLLELHQKGDSCDGQVTEVASVLGEIADWLNRAGRLTEHGELARDRLATCGFTATARSARGGERGSERGGQRRLPTWRAEWQSAGGRLRAHDPHATRVPVAWADLDGLLARLGAPSGVEINTLADERARADQTIDHLSLMSVRDPERFTQVTDQLRTLPPCATRDLLTGHVAYIREQFDVAAAVYAGLLADLPHDIDLWRDFAFALRHLGEVELNEIALFRLPDVVERACACQLELGPLDVLRLEPERWRPAPAPVRLLVGLLEWIRVDPDHR